MEKGKVYKLRNPLYIRDGQDYSLSSLQFSNGFNESEVTLNYTKQEFEGQLKYTPLYLKWAEMHESENSHYNSNFDQRKNEIYSEFKGPHIYFPPNRFEEPAWLNESKLKNKVEYTKNLNIREQSNRQVIQYAPMEQNQSWLLDLLYDCFAIETKTFVIQQHGQQAYRHLEQAGPATILRKEVDKFLVKLLGGVGSLKWSVGKRLNRSIGITNEDGSKLTSNLFSLSTGQAVLLDLFITILRHADMSIPTIGSLEDIKGLVVIDEVDLHLHSNFQHEILPELIKSFPRVQFIMSSHSPLFLLGMEKVMGEDGFRIIDLPSCETITVERFNEFESAYKYLTNTRKFESDISNKISVASQPLLIVEGTTDIDYIKKAAEHLEETYLLGQFELLDGDGCTGLNKIWKNLCTEKWTNISQTVILLYDCDQKSKKNEIGKAFQRTIPNQKNLIAKGVENLLPTKTVKRAWNHKAAFVDYRAVSSGMLRGEKYETPENWEINPNEKKNLCVWLCENGTKEDFTNFSTVFEILRDCLGDEL